MKTTRTIPTSIADSIHQRHSQAAALPLLLILLVLSTHLSLATIPAPGDPPPWLDYWTFDNTNTWVTMRGYQPASFTNITTSELGDYWTANVDNTNGPAWLNYRITEADGTNHLRLDQGSVMFWFAPNWSGTNAGGTGPGVWSRLIEVGAYTTNASHGWWSLYVDPAGANIFFSSQTNDGYGATYLSAPITWNTTNLWHLIALTYSGTNSAVWIDAVPVTNGPPVTYLPPANVLTNGFFIGSDSSGLSQAHGMFDDLSTYDHPLDGATITNSYWIQSVWYYLNPMNLANFASAPSNPTFTPEFNAVTGIGYLIQLSNAVSCVTDSHVWLTNFTAAMTTNSSMNVTFTIAGGYDATPYDVFANSVLDFSTNRTVAWAWMGQGYHCKVYMLTNLPLSGAFLVLGTPLDSDADGLTDAYEALTSKTNPLLWDTDGDGKSDGIEVALGTDPLSYNAASPIELPTVGSSYLRILAPDLLEMVRITADTNSWNFVSNNVPVPPAPTQFQVRSGGSLINVSQVGFKRRPLYAPLESYDFRIENALYLRLASTNWAASNATIEVTTTNTTLWPATMRFVSVNDPLRYSPAIHISQAGYTPNYQKKAMLGYYLGNLGEMQISTNLGFKLVDTTTGAQVYPSFGLSTLTARPDDPSTWSYIGTNSQAQYQNVLEADFSGFNTIGHYKLVVPGIGASYPFWIHDGSAMSLARTYALGLYHQRCGSGPGALFVNDSQYTRFFHTNCHVAKATIPLPVSSYSSTWFIMSNSYGNVTYTGNSENPPQLAPPVTNYSAFLFGFSNQPFQGIDVSGGHHDAGDYSKYTINSALLVHILTFAADNLGLTNFLNLGLPESTNAIPDILDEARIEADFLAKMQDNDGGFYFLAYPRDREYEGDVLPQNGDPQIVWPKTTAATAAAVGALADLASSVSFRQYYPSNVWGSYLGKAQQGWTFLTNAIGKYGKAGCYQRITIYGDDFTHDDELAWAAAALYAATGNSVYSNKLYQWYPNPADGHNGYNFKRYDSTNNFPTSTNLFVAIAYAAKTNDVLNTTNRMWFTIWDSTGQKLVTNKIDTAIPHVRDIAAISNRLFQLKVNLNQNPNALDRNYALDTISSLVGECHKTWRDGWLRCFAGYGCAVRDYAFAARSGRLSTNQLNAALLQQCETEILARATDVRTWSTNNAYGTSLDNFSKQIYDKGWFFAGDQAFDVAVADKIRSDAGNVPTIIENLNYEAGRNPLNVPRLTGLGSYRQREIVHQFAQNNPASVLPPIGVPLGNIASYFDIPYASSAWQYGFLEPVCSPAVVVGASDKTSFPFYERWSETYNIHTEFVHLQTARGLAAAAYLVTAPSMRTQSWSRASANIQFPNGPPTFGRNCTAQLSSTQDLSQAEVVWDPGRINWNFYGQNPSVGPIFTFLPYTTGERTLSVEAELPDGRRVFAVTNIAIWDPVNGGTNFVSDTNTVALYHFDTNAVSDSSGHSYTLTAHTTVTNGVALTNNANWMANPTGHVVRFVGPGNYLDVQIPTNNLPLKTNSQFTIETRIYPRAFTGSGQSILLLSQVYNSPSYATQWGLYFSGGAGAPDLYANCCAMLSGSDLAPHLTPYIWHKFKLTFSNGTTRAYVDDGLVGTSTNSPVYSLPDNWVLTFGNFDGDLDELRISNTVRP